MVILGFFSFRYSFEVSIKKNKCYYSLYWYNEWYDRISIEVILNNVIEISMV